MLSARADDVKEKLAYVARDYDREMKSAIALPQPSSLAVARARTPAVALALALILCPSRHQGGAVVARALGRGGQAVRAPRRPADHHRQGDALPLPGGPLRAALTLTRTRAQTQTLTLAPTLAPNLVPTLAQKQ